MTKTLSLNEYDTNVVQLFLMQKGFVNKIHIGTVTTFVKGEITVQVPR